MSQKVVTYGTYLDYLRCLQGRVRQSQQQSQKVRQKVQGNLQGNHQLI